jgi:hypothetical protein
MTARIVFAYCIWYALIGFFGATGAMAAMALFGWPV